MPDIAFRTQPRRVVVVGASACGKTTFARALSQRIGTAHIELDTMCFKRRWVPVPLNEFIRQVEAVMQNCDWIIDGNYAAVREIVWSRAQLAFWLDYSLLRRLRRLVWRAARDGIRERRGRLVGLGLSIMWALRTHYNRRRQLEELFARPRYAHLQVVRLRSPREEAEWLAPGRWESPFH